MSLSDNIDKITNELEELNKDLMDIRDDMDVKKKPLFQRLKHLFSADTVLKVYDTPAVNYTMGPSTTFNSSTLQDAIADAKAVRATALSNAKNALYQAFSNSPGSPLSSQSVPPLSIPGYSIDFSPEPIDHFKDEVGDFSTRDDLTGAISGYILSGNNMPTGLGKGQSGPNFYSTGYVYAPYIPAGMTGPVDSHGNPSLSNPKIWKDASPLDATAKANKVVNDAMEKSKKVLDKSIKYNKSASYLAPAFDPVTTPKSSSYLPSPQPVSYITKSFVDPKSKFLPLEKENYGKDGSGAIGQSSPLTRTGNIASVSFDVIIGRPQFSRQINAIDYNGEKIPLERYRDKIKMAINDFHKQITAKYGDEKPKYKIGYGGMFDPKELELTFTGLMFDNFKIVATFMYEQGRLKNDVEGNKELMTLLNEVGRNCEFFVTGDIEWDEQYVLITEMKLESFNYNNRNTPGFNNVLFSI